MVRNLEREIKKIQTGKFEDGLANIFPTYVLIQIFVQAYNKENHKELGSLVKARRVRKLIDIFLNKFYKIYLGRERSSYDWQTTKNPDPKKLLFSAGQSTKTIKTPAETARTDSLTVGLAHETGVHALRRIWGDKHK